MKKIVTFMWYSNGIIHSCLKAEFVTLVSLKVPLGLPRTTTTTPKNNLHVSWVPKFHQENMLVMCTEPQICTNTLHLFFLSIFLWAIFFTPHVLCARDSSPPPQISGKRRDFYRQICHRAKCFQIALGDRSSDLEEWKKTYFQPWNKSKFFFFFFEESEKKLSVNAFSLSEFVPARRKCERKIIFCQGFFK